MSQNSSAIIRNRFTNTLFLVTYTATTQYIQNNLKKLSNYRNTTISPDLKQFLRENNLYRHHCEPNEFKEKSTRLTLLRKARKHKPWTNTDKLNQDNMPT